MSMRLKREGDWIQYTTEGGKTFYYNEKTCSFQWEDPFATKTAKTKITVQASSDSAEGYDHNKDASIAVNNDSNKNGEYSVESTVWKPYMDETTGHVFWYNHVTKISQWENPFEQADPSYDANNHQTEEDYYYDTATNNGNQNHDLEAFTVYHENDLGI